MDDSTGAAVSIVRPARRGDAFAIGQAHAEAWRSAFAGCFPAEFLDRAVESRRATTGVSLTRRLPADDEAVLTDRSTLLVAELQDQVVGFAHGGACTDQPVMQEIFAFYVHPRAWGTGIAQALWSEMTKLLRPHSTGPMILWTLEFATRARSFYERNGWAPTGRSRSHTFDDEHAAQIIEYAGPVSGEGIRGDSASRRSRSQ